MSILVPLLFVVTLMAASESTARASEQRVKVLGSTTLEGKVTRHGDSRLRLEGSLTDDAGVPVAGAQLQVKLPANLPGPVRPCTGVGEPEAPAPTGAALQTGTGGRFCAELGSEFENLPMRLHYEDPAGFLGEAHLEFVAAPVPLGLELHLAAPAELPLDAPLHVIEVTAVPPAGVTAAPESPWSPLRVSVALEAPHREPKELGELRVHPGERGRLELRASELGTPGSSILIARFDGNDVWAPAEARRHVAKTAVVFVEAPPSLSVDHGDFPIDVAVQARFRGGIVPTGTVEAAWGSQLVGTAAVFDGKAQLRIDPNQDLLRELGGSGETPVRIPLTLTYVANAPWWQPGEPARVELVLAPASVWSGLPWFLAASGILGWVAIIWRRPGSRARFQAPDVAAPPGRASIAVLDADGDAFTGQVLDAHSGAALPGAIVEILVPSLSRLTTLASARSSTPDATFALERHPDLDAPGATPRIRVAVPGYAEFERALPRRGHLLIHLVTLRRTILDRLLKWAGRKGHPWSGPLSPTPAHIARLAESRQEALTAKWALGVEAAAFGPEPPSEDLDRELREGEPP